MPETDLQLERGQAFHRAGNFQAAGDIYQRVLANTPDHPDALYLLGCLAHQTGNNTVAVGLLHKAIAAEPTQPEYYNALGVAQAALENYDEAILSFTSALEQNSGHVPAFAALSRLLKKANRTSEASEHLTKFISPFCKEGEKLCDLADALQAAEDFITAVEVYHLALSLNSSNARAWHFCGCSEIARQEFAPAVECFREALTLRPDWFEAQHNLARALYELGQVTEACERLAICADQPSENAVKSRETLAIIIPGDPQANNETILKARQLWTRDVSPTGLRPINQTLKIGYVSSFFSRDNWMKPVWGLINQHNRSAFKIHLFSDAPSSAIKHGYCLHPSDRFFDTTKLSNQELAALIETHGIEVLVDLNGYSNIRRLPMFTLRPAPVIVGWFNMYATTGMACFDYLVGDREVIPPCEGAWYVEKILRVAHSYLTFSVDYPVPPVAEAPSIRNGHMTFGCLGSQYKITNEVVEAWSRILKATPKSRLLLKNKLLGSTTARNFTQRLFASHGIEPGRILFEGPEDHFDFLKAYDKVDLALDTFPYNGGTTTTEAIWQGVPVLTFRGDRWASRTSASILCAGGLDDFVADNLDGFVNLATRIANSPDELTSLAELRAGMRQRLAASSVCDTSAFAREMEELYNGCR